MTDSDLKWYNNKIERCRNLKTKETGTMNEINEIGSRLRELREASDYTVERLSAELKVDPEVYRGYEQDGKDIPISLIYEVANKFRGGLCRDPYRHARPFGHLSHCAPGPRPGGQPQPRVPL